jgi:hypothetical protein
MVLFLAVVVLMWLVPFLVMKKKGAGFIVYTAALALAAVWVIVAFMMQG